MTVQNLKGTPQVFKDGLALIEGYKACNGNIAFILMDLNMPKMDGF
jgi:CheY-like chemotaxis protein